MGEAFQHANVMLGERILAVLRKPPFCLGLGKARQLGSDGQFGYGRGRVSGSRLRQSRGANVGAHSKCSLPSIAPCGVMTRIFAKRTRRRAIQNLVLRQPGFNPPLPRLL